MVTIDGSWLLSLGWGLYCSLGILLRFIPPYAALCFALRFRKMRSMKKKFGYHTRDSLANMTLDDAYQIQTWLAEQEFPQVFSASIFFALFKTYSIPSISKLLVGTSQLAFSGDNTRASKRAADTSVLLTNMVVGKPGSRRAMEAVARTNYLHNIHRSRGKISNDDMLYTLSLFTLEGMHWTDKYEWRRLTDMERCAMATFWKALGEDLEITYDQLPSHETGWKDGLVWLEELDRWRQEYELRAMRPSEFNQRLAQSTLNLLVAKVPMRYKATAKKFACILLDKPLRRAMLLADPPPEYVRIFNIIVEVRRLMLRFLCLPRPYFLRRIYILDDLDPVTGRYHVPRWRVRPWYAKPSFKDRWGIRSWLAWATGRPGSEVGDPKFMPEGYLIPEVGPKAHVGKGGSEMQKTVEALSQRDPGRCPFFMG